MGSRIFFWSRSRKYTKLDEEREPEHSLENIEAEEQRADIPRENLCGENGSNVAAADENHGFRLLALSRMSSRRRGLSESEIKTDVQRLKYSLIKENMKDCGMF